MSLFLCLVLCLSVCPPHLTVLCLWLFTGTGLKRPYEDGVTDDKDLIKKMKRNLRKGKWRPPVVAMQEGVRLIIAE